MRVSLRNIQRYLFYLLPISLLLGTNIPLLSVGGRTVYLGTNELLIFLLLILLLQKSLKHKLKLDPPTRILWGIFLFSTAVVYSTVINIFTNQDIASVTSYIEVARWFEYLSVLLITLVYIRSEIEVMNILKILTCCLTIFIGYSLYQATSFNFYEQRIYGLFVSGADREGVSISNPNVVGALFMGTSLFFSAFSLRHKFKCRAYFRTLLLPSIAVMVLSLSRSAFLGFLAGVVVLMLGYQKKIMSFIVVFSIVILVLFMLVTKIDVLSDRIADSFNLRSDTASAVAVLDRLSNWNLALAQVPENIWFGVGFGDFEKHFGFLTPDNHYVEILATTGIAGLVSLLVMLLIILIEVSGFKCRHDDFLHSLKFGYIASLLGFMVANFFGGLFTNPRLLGLFWLLTGTVIRAFQLRSDYKVAKRDYEHFTS